MTQTRHVVPSPHAEEAFISVRDVTKAFNGEIIYKAFDVDLARGTFTTIFGPNGCGKSTLINMMSGIVPLDSGHISIDGRDFRTAKIGYVFQNYRDSLFPWLNALENIEYPLKVKGVARTARRERVAQLLATFEISLDLRRRIYELSGGQQQLVAILRALVAEPEVLFLDEPFSALDYEMTLYMRDKLQAVFLETGLTTVLVSHDLEEAVYLADRVMLLSRRPTRVVELIRYDTPRPRTIETLSDARFIEVKQHALDLFRAQVVR